MEAELQNSDAGADHLADIIWAIANEVSNSEMYKYNYNLGEYIANSGVAYYAQIIPGSVIGGFQQKLFPLSELAAGYELEFFTDSITNVMVGDQTSIALDACRLHLCVIEFNNAIGNINYAGNCLPILLWLIINKSS